MPKVERRPDPPPLKTDNQRVALVGTALWLLAFVVLAVFFRDQLADHDRTWWLATCGIGVLCGVYGIWYTRKR